MGPEFGVGGVITVLTATAPELLQLALPLLPYSLISELMEIPMGQMIWLHKLDLAYGP